MSAPKLDAIIKQVGEKEFPPVHLWHPDFCGDIDMAIKRDGSWYYMGTPIARERMVKLFSSILRKDEDGKTYLVTPVEKVGIVVEDAHFIVTALEVEGESADTVITFTTNVGDTFVLDTGHPIRVEVDQATGEPRPYVAVRGRLEALLSRSVFYELVSLGYERENCFFISSAGEEFCLGRL